MAETDRAPGAATQPKITAASVATQVRDGSKQAVKAIPALREAPQIWIEKVVASGGGPGVAFGFWMVALAGLMAAAPMRSKRKLATISTSDSDFGAQISLETVEPHHSCGQARRRGTASRMGADGN